MGKTFFPRDNARREFESGDSGAKQKSVETVIGSYSSRTIYSLLLALTSFFLLGIQRRTERVLEREERGEGGIIFRGL